MIQYSDSHSFMALARLGDTSNDENLHPSLTSEGDLVLHSGERVLFTETAKKVAQEGYSLPPTDDFVEMLRLSSNIKLMTVLAGVTIIVTNQRVAWIVPDTNVPGESIAGQVQHHWLGSVAFRPKQGFFLESVIQLDVREDFDDGTSGWFGHTIEFIFDKRFHPGSLATRVAHAVSMHHLEHGAPEFVRSELQAQAEMAVPANPEKGEEASIFFPSWVSFPKFPVSYGPDHPYGEWEPEEQHAEDE